MFRVLLGRKERHLAGSTRRSGHLPALFQLHPNNVNDSHISQAHHHTAMFSSFHRKKTLTTYSRKAPRINHRSALASPSSDDRQYRKRRVTLTSPVRGDSLPTSSSSISLSLSEQADDEDDEDDEVSQAATNVIRSQVQRHPEPSPAQELAFGISPDRGPSPVSSSEHDSISEEDLMPAGHDSKKRSRGAMKPQPLSKLRKSLKPRLKNVQVVVKRPTSILSTVTLLDIERGADGFDEVNLVLPAVSRPRNKKRKVPSSIARLDTFKGPHPRVQFDHLDWLKVPYEDVPVQEPENTFDINEAPEEQPKSGRMFVEDVRPKEEGVKSPSKLPTRPSTKEVLLYAQLSSVSAPILRRPSYDQESEDGYANGFLYEGDGELEQRMSDAEQEELGMDSVS